MKIFSATAFTLIWFAVLGPTELRASVSDQSEIIGTASHCQIKCIEAYFDLGNTLVDTTGRDSNGEIARIFYFKNSYPYLRELQKQNVTLGMIINVPGAWDIAQLKNYVDLRWIDKEHKAFDWDLFGTHIYVPGDDDLRKPDTFMFQLAVKDARSRQCVPIYQGEDFMTPQQHRIDTVLAAQRAGMVGVLIDQVAVPYVPTRGKEQEWAMVDKHDGFIPATALEKYVTDHLPAWAKKQFCTPQ